MRRASMPGPAGALRSVLVLCALCAWGPSSTAQPTTAKSANPGGRPEPVAPASIAKPFPVSKLANLNAASGGPEEVDLADSIGKQPVVFLYWIAGNPRADRTLERIQELKDELGGDRVAFYALAYQQPGRDAAVIRKRCEELGVRLPVLDDVGFRLGQQLQVRSSPNLAILDAEGNLRLASGGALSQEIEYKLTVEGAIRRVAQSGKLGTHGHLARYYPVMELVGEKSPDFKAPTLTDSVERRWYSLLDDAKLNVLIFWSVDCPHCRTSLPEINAWLRENPDGINLVTAANVTNETTRIKTREFCDLNEFTFPTLVDDNLRIAGLFQVTSTPTLLIIRPDGIVDSVVLSTTADFAKALEQKKRELL